MANRLKQEKSPYLMQHGENPVDWYPWCEEAFQKATREDKPIFLSIGYSTCHWCHVMAHESFADSEVADLLNREFVSIKVDREERPDIDAVYMSACQTMTGSGGWPLTIRRCVYVRVSDHDRLRRLAADDLHDPGAEALLRGDLLSKEWRLWTIWLDGFA